LIVIDASAILEILLLTSRADRLMDRALGSSDRLHAPELLDIEVAHVLRRLLRHKEITSKRADEALGDFAQLAIERHAHGPLLSRIWELRDVLTAYDGAYIALAEGLDAPLLTCDGKLSRATGHRARVNYVGTTP
jgi:predicted nucleic acid-binding protein